CITIKKSKAYRSYTNYVNSCHTTTVKKLLAKFIKELFLLILPHKSL
uniref:Uncharacterized protein n=1 Tax=Amphimedon queenslandica TaxID=400682 RepID=A0A1X7URM8_AMPQE